MQCSLQDIRAPLFCACSRKIFPVLFVTAVAPGLSRKCRFFCRRVVLWPVMTAELQFRPFTLPYLATFTMFFDKSTNNFHKNLDFSYFNTTPTDRQAFLSCGLILLFNFTNLLFSTASLAVWPSLMRGLSFLMLSAQFPANISEGATSALVPQNPAQAAVGPILRCGDFFCRDLCEVRSFRVATDHAAHGFP